jgi:GT2 family glycosyltransferase
MTTLSIIVPTRDRPRQVAEFLRRLEAVADEAECEVLIVDGSEEIDTEVAVSDAEARLGARVVYRRVPGLPSPAARNVALADAQGSACVFLNDDCWPREGWLRRHAEFHRRRSDRRAALIGRTAPHWPYEPTPFERWLEVSGIRHHYAELSADAEGISGGQFLTFNASAKTELLREVGGFDERFEMGFEDTELGLRLVDAGMNLRYDPDAIVDHFHPASLEDTLRMLRRYGRTGQRRLAEVRLDDGPPRRPGPRHRAAAVVLDGALAVRPRGRRTRAAAWRFLCAEALREGWWEERTPEGAPVRVGSRVARRALRDPGASAPDTRASEAPLSAAPRANVRS